MELFDGEEVCGKNTRDGCTSHVIINWRMEIYLPTNEQGLLLLGTAQQAQNHDGVAEKVQLNSSG